MKPGWHEAFSDMTEFHIAAWAVIRALVCFRRSLENCFGKSAARDAMAVTLARGSHKLSYDPNFIAAKKVTQQEREKEQPLATGRTELLRRWT